MTDTAGSVGAGFFEASPDLLAIVASDGRLLRVNPAWSRALGWSDDELRGRQLQTLVHADDWSIAVALGDVLHGGAVPDPVELRLVARDGTPAWYQWTVTWEPEQRLYYGAARDVSETREAIAAMRRSEERYRELFHSHPVPMAVWDPATREILAVNTAATVQYGYTAAEAIGMRIERLIHPDDLPRLLSLMPHVPPGLATAEPFRHIRRDGTVIEVEVTGHPLEYGGRPARLVMAIDVTERRRLEEQLRQAQKMEAMGRLAGGVAHDFNNLLTAIGGYSELLLLGLPETDSLRHEAEQIHQAAARAASLTAQLLTFSRRQPTAPDVLDVHALVRGIEPMVRRLVGEGIAVGFDLSATSPFVRADPARLEQVVINLALNARDAMPTGGSVTVRVTDASAPSGVSPGESWLLLEVRDTGSGMPEDVRRRAFDPFFTTKEPGKGTGLGLATTYGTVEQSGGRVEIRSEPGRGTAVRILLPRAVEPEAAAEAAAVTATADTRRGGCVLIVEDEPAIRALSERVLRAAGHEVLTAATGDDAIALVRAREAPIDLLLTDVVMPGGNGVDLARRMRELRPGLPVLYVSGFADDILADHGATEPHAAFLAKPFSADALRERVASMLASARVD